MTVQQCDMLQEQYCHHRPTSPAYEQAHLLACSVKMAWRHALTGYKSWQQHATLIQALDALPQLLQQSISSDADHRHKNYHVPGSLAPLMASPAVTGPQIAWNQHQLRSMAFWNRSKAPVSQQSPIKEETWVEPGANTIPDQQEITTPSDAASSSIDPLEQPDSLPLPTASTEAVTAIQEACSSVEEIAIQAAQEQSILLGSHFITAVQQMHDHFDLPWWSAIAAVNIMTRIATLPVILASQKATTRMVGLNLQLLPIRKLQEAMARAVTTEQQMHIHAAWAKQAEELRTLHGPTISRTMLTMFGTLCINSVVFLSIFNGINNLMVAKAPSLAHGGMLWFNDLTLPDPYYGLPVLCSLTTLAMIQYGMNVTGEQMASPERAGQAAALKNIFRLFALLFIPLGGYVPSGVAILWASNSLFSVFMGIGLRQDSIRRAVGLPTMSEMHATSEKLQALNAADPMSFVPPMHSASAPPPGTSAGQLGLQSQPESQNASNQTGQAPGSEPPHRT